VEERWGGDGPGAEELCHTDYIRDSGMLHIFFLLNKGLEVEMHARKIQASNVRRSRLLHLIKDEFFQ
jgi:hypothetical protein